MVDVLLVLLDVRLLLLDDVLLELPLILLDDVLLLLLLVDDLPDDVLLLLVDDLPDDVLLLKLLLLLLVLPDDGLFCLDLLYGFFGTSFFLEKIFSRPELLCFLGKSDSSFWL